MAHYSFVRNSKCSFIAVAVSGCARVTSVLHILGREHEGRMVNISRCVLRVRVEMLIWNACGHLVVVMMMILNVSWNSLDG